MVGASSLLQVFYSPTQLIGSADWISSPFFFTCHTTISHHCTHYVHDGVSKLGRCAIPNQVPARILVPTYWYQLYHRFVRSRQSIIDKMPHPLQNHTHPVISPITCIKLCKHTLTGKASVVLWPPLLEIRLFLLHLEASCRDLSSAYQATSRELEELHK